jgi:hypothetical protein
MDAAEGEHGLCCISGMLLSKRSFYSFIYSRTVKASCMFFFLLFSFFHFVQISIIIPWVSTHHHQTRCFAHLIVYTLLCAHPDLLMTSTESGSHGPCGAQFLREFVSFTQQNAAAQRLLETCPLSLSTDFARLAHPKSLLQAQSVLVGACESEPVECAPVSVIQQLGDFLEAERKTLRQQQSCISDQEPQLLLAPPAVLPTPLSAPAIGEFNSTGHSAQGYQRKVEPWRAIGGGQARSAFLSMDRDEQLVRLMGRALDFETSDDVCRVQDAVGKESMRATLLSEAGALSSPAYGGAPICISREMHGDACHTCMCPERASRKRHQAPQFNDRLQMCLLQ